jgi:hypothetical protein
MNRYISALIVAAFVTGAPIAASAYPVYEFPIAVNNACAWHLITSPNKYTGGSNYQNVLIGVVANTATDAWADGYYANTTGAHSLLEHWNGSTWAIVNAPAPSGGNSDVLNGIGATSSTDVWGVGTYFNIAANRNLNLILHYDGVSWKVIPSPNVANANNLVRKISADSPTDAWAIGYSTDLTSGNTAPLMMHWNGVKWKIVTPYNLGEPYSVLIGVKAFDPSSVYTIGDFATDQAGSFLKPQGAHYTGAWTLDPMSAMGTGSSPVNAMAAFSAKNMWALGDFYDGTNFQTLAEHWNGSTWKIIASPDPGGPEGSGDNTVLFGAAAVTANNAWGVGLYFDGVLWQTYTMEWTGAKWVSVTSPDYGGADAYYNQLVGASAIPGTTDVWAVGDHGATAGSNNNVPSKTLILKFHC